MATANRKRRKRHPDQWYVEPEHCVRQLFEHINFSGTVIYDPCCGGGNILDVAKAKGLTTIGSDIVNRGASVRHKFSRGNFLAMRKAPSTQGKGLSIVSNTPYGDEGEKLIRHAMKFPFRHAAFLLPMSWLVSEGRYHFFTRDHPPTQLLFLSQRPTMPPGDMIKEMATPFEGGQIDYFWLYYRRGTNPRPADWLKPDKFAK